MLPLISQLIWMQCPDFIYCVGTSLCALDHIMFKMHDSIPFFIHVELRFNNQK